MDSYHTLQSDVDIEFSRRRIFKCLSEKEKRNAYFVGSILKSILYACLTMGTIMVSGNNSTYPYYYLFSIFLF